MADHKRDQILRDLHGVILKMERGRYECKDTIAFSCWCLAISIIRSAMEAIAIIARTEKE